jgi:hypothetical protein
VAPECHAAATDESPIIDPVAMTGPGNAMKRLSDATDRGDMSKQEMREEAERLIKEAMEKKSITIKQGSTRIEAVCGKCGAPNRVSAPRGQTRVRFTCKECGQEQSTL